MQNKRSAFKEVDKKVDVNKIIKGMQRYIPLILISTLLFGLLGSAYTWHNLTTYRATAYLLYNNKIVDTSGSFDYNISELSLPTAIELILNPAHLDAIVSILGLDISPDDLKEELEVPPPLRNSNVITINANNDNPNLAIDIANTLAKVSVRSARDYLQTQFSKTLNIYKKELDEVNRELVRENNAKNVPTERMNLAKLLREQELTQARLERLQMNYNQILLKLNNPQGNLELYLPAEEAKPKNRKLLTYIMPFIGLFFGFLSGLIVAFFLEMLDSRLRTK